MAHMTLCRAKGVSLPKCTLNSQSSTACSIAALPSAEARRRRRLTRGGAATWLIGPHIRAAECDPVTINPASAFTQHSANARHPCAASVRLLVPVAQQQQQQHHYHHHHCYHGTHLRTLSPHGCTHQHTHTHKMHAGVVVRLPELAQPQYRRHQSLRCFALTCKLPSQPCSPVTATPTME